jgi:hypothetical protein
VTHIDGISIPKKSHAKIIFYSKGRRDKDGAIAYPFNVEMNINHERWHLRENDPTGLKAAINADPRSWMQIKYSFGNPLDDGNEIKFSEDPASRYVPQIDFTNLNWTAPLVGSNGRFNALAGWNKDDQAIWDVLNDVTRQIFSQFQSDGNPAQPDGVFGHGKDFGWGTVHHAVGTLRMPYKVRFDAPEFDVESVVDENLMVRGHPGLYVCDMSVLPFSSSANPVRTLAALALRLSERLVGQLKT